MKYFSETTAIDGFSAISNGQNKVLDRSVDSNDSKHLILNGPKGPSSSKSSASNFSGKGKKPSFGHSEMKQASASSSPPEEVLKGKAVLVVEDNRNYQLMCSTILENHGAQVRVVNNGKEAIEAVKGKDFDLILMDIEMPVMNGIEATKQIRKLDGPKGEVKIMAVTSLTADHATALYIQVGMNDAMGKPFEEEQLLFKSATLMNINYTIGQNGNVRSEDWIDLSDLWDKSRGSNAFVIQMLEIFLEDYPMYLKALEELVEKQDWEEVKRMAHKMKSPASVIKAAFVWDILRFFEYLEIDKEEYTFVQEQLLVLREHSQKIVRNVEDKLISLKNAPL